MKIKLTEEQYNRLLVENDKDFLEGQVNFRHVGNKINKFIVKLFNILKKKGISELYPAMNMLKGDFSLDEDESLMLAYNYLKFINKSSFDDLIGEPLDFYGKFSMDMDIPMYTNMAGWIPGKVLGFGTSYEDFIEKMEDADYDNVSLDNRSYVEYDVSNADWEVDDDYLYDRVGDIAMDIDIEDQIHLGW